MLVHLPSTSNPILEQNTSILLLCPAYNKILVFKSDGGLIIVKYIPVKIIPAILTGRAGLIAYSHNYN